MTIVPASQHTAFVEILWDKSRRYPVHAWRIEQIPEGNFIALPICSVPLPNAYVIHDERGELRIDESRLFPPPNHGQKL